MGERRVFTQAFKKEAVWLVQMSGRSMTSIAEGLGITVNMLCLRKRESQKAVTEKNITVFPGHGNARDEEAARLRKEVADFRETNEILKRAVTIFTERKPRQRGICS